MLIVPIEEAEAGMSLAADILHPSQPDQVLLKRGYVLDKTVLAKMADLGVLAVYVDYPGLGDLDRHLQPSLSPERLRIYGQVKSTIAAVQKTARPTVGFSDYYCAIREFVITLFQQGDHPLYLEQIAVRLGDEAVAHATAVAHLALLLGIRLRGYLKNQRQRLPAHHAVEVVNLGIAGMLHDIGKCKLAPELGRHSSIHPPRADDVEKRAAWETHPDVGYEMIRRGVEPSAAAAVLHHHQRFDGAGFPMITRKGKTTTQAGQSIHVFARVLQAADLFDRLTHQTGDGIPTRRPAFQVLHELHEQYASWLDPKVLAALEQVIPPFPPGSKVRLSDGTDAVVTAQGVKEPYRPVVRRLNSDQRSVNEQAIDLSSAGAPQIDSVDGIAVGDFMPAAPAVEVPVAAAPVAATAEVSYAGGEI